MKRLAGDAARAATDEVKDLRREAIRWRCRHCGASVVTALGAVTTEMDPKMSHGNPPERPSLRAPRAARNGLRSRGPFPRVRPAAGPSRRPSLSAKSITCYCHCLFAPASSEQAFCSLGCDVSQVVIDCVSESDILLFIQEQ
jgi:hypothetical protein